MNLTGKNVFVSGSSRGIGAQIALEFAKKGANVVLNGRTKVSEELIADIKAQGVTCEVVLGDISNEADVLKMVKEATEKWEILTF